MLKSVFSPPECGFSRENRVHAVVFCVWAVESCLLSSEPLRLGAVMTLENFLELVSSEFRDTTQESMTGWPSTSFPDFLHVLSSRLTSPGGGLRRLLWHLIQSFCSTLPCSPHSAEGPTSLPCRWPTAPSASGTLLSCSRPPAGHLVPSCLSPQSHTSNLSDPFCQGPTGTQEDRLPSLCGLLCFCPLAGPPI